MNPGDKVIFLYYSSCEPGVVLRENKSTYTVQAKWGKQLVKKDKIVEYNKKCTIRWQSHPEKYWICFEPNNDKFAYEWINNTNSYIL